VAQIELEGLYTDYVFTENEKVYVRALKIMGCAPLIVGRIGQGKVSVRARLSHLSECLRFTCVMLNSIHSEFDDNIKYSIAALGELFPNTINTLRSIWKIDIPLLGYPWAKGFLRSEGEIEAKMIDTGWCLSDIERARFAYTGLNTVHLLSRLKRPLPLRKHDKCTRDRCEAFQIDPKSYTLSHSQAGCSCSEIGVDIQAVLSILNGTDSYPVLSITVPEQGYNGVKISVEKYRQDLPYVALSHVSSSWYFKGRMFLTILTGLGRWTWQPERNSLQCCQIARLVDLVTKLQETIESTASSKQPKYLFWIDTLCCPVEKKAKKVALERIADVYRNATYVLVLDASLSPYPSKGVHCAELLLRISGSAWMRRLWTLQG
jgi:Heterokaryon incompatibility protein (HET)